MKTIRCGRLDRHEPHEWARPLIANIGPIAAQTYSCAGEVVIEGGYWQEWDAIDDAAEDQADREQREAS